MERMAVILERLQQAFAPTHLEVIDDCEKHRGHEGARDGAGHYTVVIAAPCFEEKSRVEIHREIYAILSDLMPHEIHALVIKLKE